MKRLFLAGIAVFLFTFGLFVVRSHNTSSPDFPNVTSFQGLPEVIIEIPTGSTGSDIGQILFKAKVVKSSASFFRVAVGDSRSEKIAPGSHRITMKISAAQALDQLLDPSRIPNLIKIYEGGWKSEVVESLKAYGFSSQEIDQAFKDVRLPRGLTSAEGVLFPAQYTFAKGVTATEAVQAMVDRFTQESVSKLILKGNQDFTPSELLTIASIVQAEGDIKDYPQVARVILNRLKIGMPLQLDSTVHYIKKVRGQIFLSTQSTLINSPYNTYKRYGLPPGPIGSPGVDAMTAALKPASGDWLFFITVAPGDTRFTKSIDEFNTWKSLYEKNRKAGAFK
ncbi:MAG: hypothetical protein RL129_869 [Actinomycetota bacterium]|jgi:UPF0755 protein